ncbi:MAG TPA: tetratricopeptide repeat protein, partial [Candidatus Competibacter sp.]|nr:tetratricopeptide repeat protein [Candidatus Competibacter sp.]
MIFVHGLGGHAYDTWRRKADDGSFWPLWLAEDVEGLAVYTLGYEAPPSNWLGTTMPLQDRAVNVLECLLGETNLRDGPITFICHSLGGLLVKQIVLDLQRQKGRRPEAAMLLDRITQVVFLATPHTGSRQGSWLERLRFLAWPSSITRTLVANDPTLRAINVSYRGLADELRDSLHHRIFYETQGTPAGVIVDEASADPGLSGLPPVPVDADHIGIVKPADRSALQYARIRDFVAENSAPVEHRTGFEARPLPALKFERPWNIAPKLLRIALLALVCTIVFKGVQALVAPAPINMGSIERKLDELKALSEQLVAQSATRSVPGAERSVGEAVAAAGQGAAEGDERMKKALALLKENRIAEAEALFRAVAVDREAQAKQNARAAAIAYRNLGAIAGLRDPKRALDAYAKAIESDPDDLESLFWAGWLQRERGDLREAERRFKRVFKLAIPENQAWFIYWARIGIGDVLVAQGSLPEALKAYRDSLAIADRLAQADPGNAGWQRDLSVSYDRIGDVLVAQGSLPEALKAYRDSLAIADRLAQADPGNAGWQHDLSVSYEKIGDVLVAQGNLPAALKTYRDGLAIRERLAQADPGNAGWQRDLSVSYNKIGDVLVAQGNLPAALKTYRDGLAIAERLAQADPGNAGWQRDLSVSYEKIGDVLVAQGN